MVRLIVTLIVAIFEAGMWADYDHACPRIVLAAVCCFSAFTLNMIGFAVGNLVIGRVIVDWCGVRHCSSYGSAIAYYLAMTQNFNC